MKSLADYIEEETWMSFEDYSDKIICIGKYKNTDYNVYEYVDCRCNTIIVEGSFKRMVAKLNDKQFAIITAFRAKYDKRKNIQRNRDLRAILNNNHMGPIQLVGYWQENQNPDIPYSQSEKKDLIGTVERSYLVVKPQDMSYNDFEDLLKKCMVVDGDEQDSIIICKDGKIYCMYNSKDNYKMEKIGDKITYNKIAQAYSHYVRRNDVPFVIEGVEEMGSNIGKQMYQKHGFVNPIYESNNVSLIDDQWIADDKPVKTRDGRQAIVTKVDMKVVPNIIYGQVKMKDKLFDYQWEDNGKCVKALDNIGNPKKPDAADDLCKVF